MPPVQHDPEGIAELARDLQVTPWDRGLIRDDDHCEGEAE